MSPWRGPVELSVSWPMSSWDLVLASRRNQGVRFGPKVSLTGSKWKIWDFSDQISVRFDLNIIRKSLEFVPFGANLTHIWPTSADISVWNNSESVVEPVMRSAGVMSGVISVFRQPVPGPMRSHVNINMMWPYSRHVMWQATSLEYLVIAHIHWQH